MYNLVVYGYLLFQNKHPFLPVSSLDLAHPLNPLSHTLLIPNSRLKQFLPIQILFCFSFSFKYAYALFYTIFFLNHFLFYWYNSFNFFSAIILFASHTLASSISPLSK